MITLRPLDDVLDRLHGLTARPVAPVRRPVARAVGAVLAVALAAPRDEPTGAVAARDGIAIRAGDSEGAGLYAPVVLPAALRVAAGAAMPAQTDAVVASGDIAWRDGCAELSQPVAAGDGVCAAGREVTAGTVWRTAGSRLEARDLPLLAALGIAEVAVRVPRVVLLATGDRFRAPAAADGNGPGLAALLAADGAMPIACPPVAGEPSAIAAALAAAAAQGDLVAVTGGTGGGEGDHAAAALAQAGACVAQGIGLRPGGSAGIGVVAGTPVLLLPGSPAEALGTWLAIGRACVQRLAAATPPPSRRVRLGRKLVSTPGLAELALLRCGEDGVAVPTTACGEPTLAGLAGADTYMIVAAGCEGYEVGAAVDCLTI
jgi:molybdopterin molybdotransferase